MEPTIRLVMEADATAIATIYAPIVERTPISFETAPPSVEELRRRIRETVPDLPWLVCEQDGSVVGYAYASPYSGRAAYRWTVTVSVYVDSQWRRRGIASGLYTSLVALLRLQGFYTAIAVIALPNEPSVSFHESMGFEHVGVYRRIGYKDGAWRDVGHWQLELQPAGNRRSPPEPPASLDELQDSGRFDEALATGTASITPS